MFAEKPRSEEMIRVVVIAAILFNALIPNPAIAKGSPGDEQNGSGTLQENIPTGIKGVTSRVFLRAESSSLNFQVETATPEPYVTPTPPVVVSDTPAPSQAVGTFEQVSTLSVGFSAAPEQVKLGDRVVFTFTITNNDALSVKGLRFTNVLPAGFSEFQSDDKGFTFNTQTRELAWEPQDTAMELLPGGTFTLTYSVIVQAEAGEARITDEASLFVDGMTVPLMAEASLTLLGAENSLTYLDQKGGEALGLQGKIRVRLPENSIGDPGAISIQEIKGMEGAPPLVFDLGLRSLKSSDSQSLLPTDSPSLEKDRLVPFETVEAKFDQPVDLTVSLDGIADLATLNADQTPYLVTLDDASGTWVRVPLEGVDRETNTITAKLTHFSTWGVGIGSSFPATGASIMLFNSAYSSLFTGRSIYSIPIWTPPGRNGMAPSLALSYSSGAADGILGDIQAPWVGMGWNVDSVEIARKITNGVCNPCGSGSYGYESKLPPPKAVAFEPCAWKARTFRNDS